MTVNGTTATVVAIHAVPGAAAMWDLIVSNLHDFAVGNTRAVVHNCSDTLSPDEIQQVVDYAKDQLSAQYNTSKWELNKVENNGAPHINDDPKLANYLNRYDLRVKAPGGIVRLSADFNPETREWNLDQARGIHLSGTQLNEYWQVEADLAHDLL